MKRKDIPCKICGLVIANAWGHTVHMKRHNKELKHRCTLCESSYVSKYELQVHSLRHKGDEGLIFKCRICSEGFSNRSSMYIHEDKHQLTLYKCKHCDMAFHSRLKRGKHQNVHKRSQTMCSKCNKIFVNERFLIKHYSESHPRDTRKKTDSSSKSDKNRNRKVMPRVNRCKICNEIFLLRSLLMDHLDECHPTEKNYIYRYLCSKCGKVFCDPKVYYRHVKQHTLLRSFHCTECPYKAVRKADLKKHSLTHVKFKPYKCDNCSGCFKSLSSLNYHKLVHGEKTYKCPTCSKALSSLKNLGNHLNRHKKAKSVCDKCGKTFKEASMLMQHLKYSHASEGDTQFCSRCNTLVLLSKYKQHSRNCFAFEKKSDCKWCNLCKKKLSREKIIEHFKDTHPLHIERCSLCHKIFLDPLSLKKHFETAHLDENDQLEDRFYSKRLKEHLCASISKDKDCIHECFACGCTFTSIAHLKEHIADHSKLLDSVRTLSMDDILKPKHCCTFLDDVRIEKLETKKKAQDKPKYMQVKDLTCNIDAKTLYSLKSRTDSFKNKELLPVISTKPATSDKERYSTNSAIDILNLINSLTSSLDDDLVSPLMELVELLEGMFSQV